MYFGESIYKYILVLEKIMRKMRRVIKYKSLVIRFLTLDLILFLEKGLKITKVVYLDSWWFTVAFALHDYTKKINGKTNHGNRRGPRSLNKWLIERKRRLRLPNWHLQVRRSICWHLYTLQICVVVMHACTLKHGFCMLVTLPSPSSSKIKSNWCPVQVQLLYQY